MGILNELIYLNYFNPFANSRITKLQQKTLFVRGFANTWEHALHLKLNDSFIK